MSDADDDFRSASDDERSSAAAAHSDADMEEEEAEEEKKAPAKGKKAAAAASKSKPSSKGSSTAGGKKAASPAKRKDSAGGGAGGPAAKKTKVISGDAAAKEELIRYMKQQNRPYTALVIYENLHHAIKRPTIVKLCDELVEEEVLQAKDFKKVRLYMAKQTEADNVTPAELEAIQSKEASVRDRLGEQKSTNARLDSQLRALQNEPSDEDLASQLASYKKQIDSLNAKLARFKNDKNPVTKEDFDRAQLGFNEALKAWRQRKRAATDLIDTMCGDEGDPKELSARLNLDLDEDNGVKMADWTPLQKDVKSVKTPLALGKKKKK